MVGLVTSDLAAEIPGDNVRRLRRPVRSLFDRRWTTAWYADLHTEHRPLPCWVEDVSANGAKLRVGFIPAGFAVGEKLSLVLPNFDAIAARLAWYRRDRIGVQFCGSERWLVELALGASAADDWFPTTAR
jgi:hypothetical protein